MCLSAYYYSTYVTLQLHAQGACTYQVNAAAGSSGAGRAQKSWAGFGHPWVYVCAEAELLERSSKQRQKVVAKAPPTWVGIARRARASSCTLQMYVQRQAQTESRGSCLHSMPTAAVQP